MWQRDGLNPPDSVREATAAYLEAEDALAAWLDEGCERDPQGWETTSALFASWKAWCERSNGFAGNTVRFRENLEVRGFTYHHSRTARCFLGLTLKAAADDIPYRGQRPW